MKRAINEYQSNKKAEPIKKPNIVRLFYWLTIA